MGDQKTAFLHIEKSALEAEKPCSVAECAEPMFKMNMCVQHYKELKDKERTEKEKKKKEEGGKRRDSDAGQVAEQVTVSKGLVVRVPRFETRDKSTFYVIEAKRGEEETKVTNYRYSEFNVLHDQLLLFYKRNHTHLANNIPPLPPKSPLKFLKPTPELLEDRRQGFEKYLQKLVLVPHAQDNPLLFEFLGLGLPPGARLKLKEGETFTAVRVAKVEVRDGVTYYVVEALTSPSSEITQTLKRYSDFEEFDERMQGYYTTHDSKLAKQLPELPIKHNKLLENHKSDDFIERRRLLLNSYLRKMIEVPQAKDNPHFWKFVGLVDYAYYHNQLQERLISDESAPRPVPASPPSSP